MHVVATAGHVDHGKSTLVRALTGMDPDRLAEERRRAMTVDLGFAWTALPSDRLVAFVDVPGHERFMTTMLAGVGPVPAVLFVVAADEGWRAQSEEHLAALDRLGVAHGLLGVTRADLADPGPAIADARARIGRTALGAVEAVAVSAVTGHGLTDLRAALDRLLDRLPAPEPDADVRLWVDRAFTVTGQGTVVTGTLRAGTLRVGDPLELLPGGRTVRVRGVQALGRRHDGVTAVARVGVNLRGVDRDGVSRGDVLVSPGRWRATAVVDGRLTGGIDGRPGGGVDGRPGGAGAPADRLVLHLGSAAVPARLRPLGTDHGRLVLARPLPLRIGDLGLLRDPGRQRVVARFTALDVCPPPLARRGDAGRRATALAGYSEAPDGAAELRRRRLVRRDDLVAMGAAPPAEPVAGDWLVDPAWGADLRRRLAEAVDHHAAAHPTAPGMPVEAARQLLDLPDRRLVEALVAPPLSHRDGRLYGRRERPALPPAAQAGVAAVRRDLAADPFVAPTAGRLADLGLDARLLAAAAGAGQVLRVADGVYLLPGADAEAVRRLAALDPPFTVGQAGQVLGTTRRVVVPLLELLDRRGWTTRLDDGRRRLTPAGYGLA